MKVNEALNWKELKFNKDEVTKKLDPYIPSANLHFFSNCKPEKIEEELTNYLKKEGMEYKTHKDKFKLKITHTGKYDDGGEGTPFAVHIIMRIYIQNDEQVCVEFQHAAGDKVQAQKFIKNYISDTLREYDDAVDACVA